MQLSTINSVNNFGAILPPVLPPVPPAIVRECSPSVIKECANAGWLKSGKEAISRLKQEGIVFDKLKNSVDVYDKVAVTSLGTLPRPTSPKSIEEFVGFMKELRKEFAEYTDSKIRLLKVKRNTRRPKPIETANLKTKGRKDVDKSPLIRVINQPS